MSRQPVELALELMRQLPQGDGGPPWVRDEPWDARIHAIELHRAERRAGDLEDR